MEQGLADLRAGRETEASLLVSVATSRLSATGHFLEAPFDRPEERLYALLARQDADSAHARYNALVRQLVSYTRAAECVAR